MNITLIVTIVILTVCALVAYKKGFVKTVFATCSLILALMLTVWLNPIVSKNLQSNDKIMDFFKEKIQTVMKLSELEEKYANMSNKQVVESLFPDILVEMLNGSMGEYIKDNTKKFEGLESIEGSEGIEGSESIEGSENAEVLEKQMFFDKLAEAIAGLVITAISFLALFILLDIVVHFVGKLLCWITEFPLLKQVNEIFGLLLGLVEGLIIVWVLCIFLTAITGTEIGQEILKQINESWFLKLIYNNNLLLRAITAGVTKFL